MTTPQDALEFGLSEDTRRLIDEVRASIAITYSMGLTGTDDSCTDISKNDLISVMAQWERTLKQALSDMPSIRLATRS